jgi:hypothetical protein
MMIKLVQQCGRQLMGPRGRFSESCPLGRIAYAILPKGQDKDVLQNKPVMLKALKTFSRILLMAALLNSFVYSTETFWLFCTTAQD